VSVKREIRSDAGFEIGFGAGLNERDAYNIDIQETQAGYNFLLDPVGTVLNRRPTQDIVAYTPNTGEITGIVQLIKTDNTQTQLVACETVLYDWNGITNFTAVTPAKFVKGAKIRSTYWPLDDYLVLTDIELSVPLYKWDGTACSRHQTALSIGSPATVSTLTKIAAVATLVTTAAHGFSTDDFIEIAGADQENYNKQAEITVINSTTFTFPVESDTVTPATGTPITVDAAVTVKAKYGQIHNGRLWLFNIKVGDNAFPHMCLASDFEDPENFDNSKRSGDVTFSSGNEAFFLYSPDLKPITNISKFHSDLVFGTDGGQLFVLTGTDATNYAFTSFYVGSGANSDEGMVNIGNDLLYFRAGKAIESLTSTDQYGDVAADDISWWIPDSVQAMDNPIAIYDRPKQRVYFFDESLNGVLVLDKTFMSSAKYIEGRLSPWSKYETTMENRFDTKAAALVRDAGEEDYTVYWGDADGAIFNINGTGIEGDAGGGVNGHSGTHPINVMRKTRVIMELNTNDEVMLGRLEYTRGDSINVDLTFSWLDELNEVTCTIPLKETLAYSEGAYWGDTELYWNDTADVHYWSDFQIASDAEQRSNVGFSAVGKSSGCVVKIMIAGVGDYTISRIYI